MTDYLFSNVDRHLNNIGILRDPNSLKFIDFAPIFDSGNSMFYNMSFEDLKKVDLPEPDGPRIVTKSPRRTSNVTS